KGLIITTTDGYNRSTDDQPDPLIIHVIQDTAPTLSYPPTPSAPTTQMTMINPATGPADNGSITSIVVQTGPAFVSVDNTTGVVTASPGAGDAGSYPVTIRAT